jgi:predicted ArsR family transcriptional regulator
MLHWPQFAFPYSKLFHTKYNHIAHYYLSGRRRADIVTKRGSDRKVSDDRILLEFLLSADPALFTSEVSDPLPLSRQRVNDLLNELEDEGLVTSKTASGRRLWWMTAKGHEQVVKSARDKLT